jgi:hypothetical protein
MKTSTYLRLLLVLAIASILPVTTAQAARVVPNLTKILTVKPVVSAP